MNAICDCVCSCVRRLKEEKLYNSFLLQQQTASKSIHHCRRRRHRRRRRSHILYNILIRDLFRFPFAHQMIAKKKTEETI